MAGPLTAGCLAAAVFATGLVTVACGSESTDGVDTTRDDPAGETPKDEADAPRDQFGNPIEGNIIKGPDGSITVVGEESEGVVPPEGESHSADEDATDASSPASSADDAVDDESLEGRDDAGVASTPDSSPAGPAEPPSTVEELPVCEQAVDECRGTTSSISEGVFFATCEAEDGLWASYCSGVTCTCSRNGLSMCRCERAEDDPEVLTCCFEAD